MNRRQPKRAQCAVPILSWLTPLGAVVSVMNVTLSLCTGEWLKSSEQIPADPSNGTQKEDFRTKKTISGLWTLCYSNIISAELQMECMRIDYFSKDRYTPEPHDSTMGIAYAVTRAGPLFIVAAILLITAIVSATLGHVSRARRVAMFIGGIIFIIAGLIMLIGLVVYLSVLQSEIGPKLRPRNSLEAPLFTYSYGFGFMLVVTGFMSTELTGISAIFWYMYWHQLDWAEKAMKNLGTPSNHVESNRCSSWGEHFHSTHRNLHRQRKERRTTEGPPKDSSYWNYRKANDYESGGCSLHEACESKDQKISYPRPSTPHFFYDEEFEMNLPLPPPPPFPRDLTSTTTVSGEEFLSGDVPMGRVREGRKTTPV